MNKLRYKNIPEVAEKVKRVLEMYSKGRFTIMDMCAFAQNIGLQSKRGNVIKYNSMQYLLRHRFYCGEWSYTDLKSGKVLYSGTANGQWEPIVEKEIIEGNEKILKSQVGPSWKSKGYDFRFRGLMVCRHCGRKVLGEFSGRKQYTLKSGKKKSYRTVYYHCHQSPYKDKTGEMVKCPMPYFPEKLVEQEIIRHLDLLQFDEEAWNQVKKQLFDFEAKDILRQEQATLRAEGANLEKRLDHLRDQKIEAEVSENYFNKKLPELEKRIDEINVKLAILNNQIEDWNDNVGRMISTVDSLKDFKSKWLSFQPKKSDSKTVQIEKKTKQRTMLKLITKHIHTVLVHRISDA